MKNEISVCLPAYNEERTIISTLESITAQSLQPSEILVCANGCIDWTAKKVREYAKGDERVKLIETQDRGKPNAWNILRKSAKHNYLFFCDGDVSIETHAFRHLYDALQTQEKIAYGARTEPFFEDCDALTRLISCRGSTGCLIGRLYAFDNNKVSETMNYWGYSQMPKDIIHEDKWLSLVIGLDNWANEDNAIVYFKPYHWKEHFNLFKRYVRADEQLQKEYGFLEIENEKKIDANARRMNKLKNMPGLRNKIELCAGYALRKAVYTLAKLSQKSKKAENSLDKPWEVSEYSKQPIAVISQ